MCECHNPYPYYNVAHGEQAPRCSSTHLNRNASLSLYLIIMLILYHKTQRGYRATSDTPRRRACIAKPQARRVHCETPSLSRVLRNPKPVACIAKPQARRVYFKIRIELPARLLTSRTASVLPPLTRFRPHRNLDFARAMWYPSRRLCHQGLPAL